MLDKASTTAKFEDETLDIGGSQRPSATSTQYVRDTGAVRGSDVFSHR